MRQIVEEVEKAAGHVLAAQGLKAVYEAAEFPDSEDDMVLFVDGEGRKSVVSIQIPSLRPSLEGAIVDVSVLKERELDEGWRYVEFKGVSYFPEPGSKEALMGQIIKALEENEGSFDLSEGGPRVVAHPLLGEALKAVDAFAEETGTEISIRGFRLGDKEGLEVSDDRGRTVRIEADPGALAVIAAGERTVITTRSSEDRAGVLKGILSEAMPSAGLRI